MLEFMSYYIPIRKTPYGIIELTLMDLKTFSKHSGTNNIQTLSRQLYSSQVSSGRINELAQAKFIDPESCFYEMKLERNEQRGKFDIYNFGSKTGGRAINDDKWDLNSGKVKKAKNTGFKIRDLYV